MSDELILHHYPTSPFAEKVRLILGYKRLAWRSVHIPIVMPKPDVIALTGGYRKTPLLQIGVDVYADTALIARVLEARQPEPALYPRAASGLAQMLAQWADSHLFWTVIPYVLQPAGVPHLFAGLPPEAVKAFMKDRAAFSAGMPRRTPADAEAALHVQLAWLESHLADGRAFLAGEAPSIADFSAAHALWFVRRAAPLAGILDAYPALAAWHRRVLDFGHGSASPMDSDDALAVAGAGTRPMPTVVEPGLGFELGDAVTVTPIDVGRDPSAGMLVGLTRDEVVVRRSDERAGTVHVHFPRLGFHIQRQENSI